jgi:phosphoribosylamine--glycine ligase
MKLLLVGGGGREHALAWRLRRENPSLEIVAAPGTPGIAEFAKCVETAATDVNALVELARQEEVDWTLVGPEAPLSLGIVDAFRAARLPIFGPTRAAAMLESSKAYSKTLMIAAGVPTARAMVCRDVSAANAAVAELGVPVVIKASGLAAGKGVIICQTADEAKAAISLMLQQNAFCRSSCSRTESASFRSPPRRITSGCSTVIAGQTRAAWARTARCRSPRVQTG